MRKYHFTPHLVLSAAFCLLPLACNKGGASKPKPSASATATAEAPAKLVVPINFKPAPEQAKLLDELRRKVDKKHWRFSTKEINKRGNAKLFTHLAASAVEPEVAGAALQAMYSAYSTHSKRKAMPDADYHAVVKYYLNSDNDQLVARALLAARTAIAGKKGDKDLAEDVVKLSKKLNTGAGRYAIIDTLRVVSAVNRSDALMKVLEESIDATEPYVLSYALQALYRSTRSIKDPEVIRAKALKLAEHEDPGVRGRAIELLGSLGVDKENKDALVKLFTGALQDKSPYVRSEACAALARIRYKPAIHAIAKLIDDDERNRYILKGWTALDGHPGHVIHDGSAWSYVNDAAMSAIRSLSDGDLKLERINPKQVKQGLDENAKLAKAWYEKNKAKIPTK